MSGSSGNLSANLQIRLFDTFWRWLLAVGGIIIGISTVLGGLAGWAIYQTATVGASNTARQTVQDHINVLTQEIDRLSNQNYALQTALESLVAKSAGDEVAARNAAERATTAANKADSLVDQAQVQLTASKASASPPEILNAAHQALTEYVHSPTFIKDVVANVRSIYDPQIASIREAITQHPLLTLTAKLIEIDENNCPGDVHTKLCQLPAVPGEGKFVGASIGETASISSGHAQTIKTLNDYDADHGGTLFISQPFGNLTGMKWNFHLLIFREVSVGTR